ncbi:LpxI family protein [Dinoroseobacter sp. S124A]|uniref:LpxI family protein n=1 Tax=Dinoroseobacter sp. S124A TaxID=3415128 RepID=UPI003C7D2594
MLALVAGRGGLPLALASALQRAGRPFRVYALEGFAPDLPDVTLFRVEALGRLLRDMRKAGISEVCFAGAMQRPPVDMAKLHPLSLSLVPRLMKVIGKGDDRLLREVIAIFEEAGLQVRGAHEVSPDLLATGAVGRQPTEAERTDAARGAEILSALGPLDLGQGCVVAGGLCLGVETLQGTDAMLGFVAETRGGLAKTAGVFVKRAKPGQDLRIDMPTIGPDTVTAAARAGLSGIAVQEGAVLVLDRDTLSRRAEEAGIAIWAQP